MNEIYKYNIDRNVNQVKIPSDALLSAAAQDNKVVIYAINNKKKPRYFEILLVPTGVAVNANNYTFLNTVALYDGSIMIHVFYRVAKPIVDKHEPMTDGLLVPHNPMKGL